MVGHWTAHLALVVMGAWSAWAWRVLKEDVQIKNNTG
jgi:hypothetical protein